MAQESFIVYHSFLKAIEPLNDAERGRLFTACLEYSMTGKAPELRGNERFIFPSWQSQMDRDKEKYEDTCKKRSKSAKLRWSGEQMQKDANASKSIMCNANDADTVSVSDDVSVSEGQDPLCGGRKRFVPPTASEVAAYCKKKNYDIDAEEFVAFYASKGWMIGKNKMVSWRGAIGTWVAKRRKESGGHQDGERDDMGRVFMDGKWVVV